MSQRVMVQDTGADTDALAGTDLEFAPGAGILEVWVASTVNTATLTAVVAGANVVRNQVLPLRANGVPNINEDPPQVQVAVLGGEKVVINLVGTTGTIHTIAQHTPEDEL